MPPGLVESQCASSLFFYRNIGERRKLVFLKSGNQTKESSINYFIQSLQNVTFLWFCKLWELVKRLESLRTIINMGKHYLKPLLNHRLPFLTGYGDHSSHWWREASSLSLIQSMVAEWMSMPTVNFWVGWGWGMRVIISSKTHVWLFVNPLLRFQINKTRVPIIHRMTAVALGPVLC